MNILWDTRQILLGLDYFGIHDKEKQCDLPSSVVEFVLSHQIASLIRGGANAEPSWNDEL
jgi:hypothetical protein